MFYPKTYPRVFLYTVVLNTHSTFIATKFIISPKTNRKTRRQLANRKTERENEEKKKVVRKENTQEKNICVRKMSLSTTLNNYLLNGDKVQLYFIEMNSRFIISRAMKEREKKYFVSSSR